MTCQCLWHLDRPDSRLVHARNIDMSVFLLPMNYDHAQISPGKRTLFGCDPAALMQSDVEKVSAEDETLQIVRECIESGDWKCLTGTVYMAVKDELWIIGQIVIRGNCIILPEKIGPRRTSGHSAYEK